MKNRIKHKIYIWLATLVLLYILQPCPALAETPPEKHILLMHQYSADYPTHQLLNEGVKTQLAQYSEYHFSYSYEYLDLARYSNDESYFALVAQYLAAKYAKDQPDFIITNLNLYQLFVQFGNDIFPDVPILIDWNEDIMPLTAMPANYTLIPRSIDIDKNIQLILQTKPSVKKIYIVIGDAKNERNILNRILEVEKKYSGQVEFVIMNKLSYAEMFERIKSADKDSAVLFFHWFADVDGNSYIPAQVNQAICREAKAPVYGIATQLLDGGLLGGYMYNAEITGRTAATAIMDILAGKKPPDIIRSAANTYVFDWRELKRWGIDENKLPAGSEIRFRETSLWDLYGGYIAGGIGLLTLEAGLIMVLLINHRKRKMAETELVQANISLQAITDRLISLDKLKDEFLAATAHELKTPIHGIQNITEAVLEEKDNLADRQKENLTLVTAISHKLTSLVNDLLDLNRLKNKGLKLKPAAVDVNMCVEVVLQVFRHLSATNQSELINQIPMDLPQVYADENRLCQVLYNLIGNALKFTEEGYITLNAYQKEEYLYISIKDTGIGIPEEKQASVFSAYEKGAGVVAEEYGGMGIGLSISKQLIEQMGGKIYLEWSEEGKGSRFTFYLPLAPGIQHGQAGELGEYPADNYDDKVLPEAKRDDSFGEAEFRILVVDDEPVNIRVMENVFARDNYEIIQALSGAQALALLKKMNNIDIVLLDVMMPKMTGFEVCRKIREDHSLLDLPVILTTVKDSQDDISAGFKAGANDYITKPFSGQELRARVGVYLELKKLLAQAVSNELAFLQVQIKPHFLYNALSGIISLCHTDSEQAGKLLSYLSNYLRRRFDFGNKRTYIPIKAEMELVNCYAEIEKARFGDDLKIEMTIDEQVLNYPIIPFAIQPLVENAIRHGVTVREEGGTVRITVQRMDQGIEVTVEDDGIGMTREKYDEIIIKLRGSSDRSQEQIKTGLGISNIHARLIKFYGQGLSIESEEGKGARIQFRIPLADEQESGLNA